MILRQQQPLLSWVPADRNVDWWGCTCYTGSQCETGGETHLALGLCFPLRAEPIHQRGLDRILNLERVYPAQVWRVPECRDGSTHIRPPRDSGRTDMLENSIIERLLSDAKSFRSYAFRDESYEWAN